MRPDTSSAGLATPRRAPAVRKVPVRNVPVRNVPVRNVAVRTVIVLASLVFAGVLLAQGEPESVGATDAWYLVFEVDVHGDLELQSSTRVRLDGLPPSRAPKGVVEPGPERFRVRLSDPTGVLIHEQWVRVPAFVRGEFHGRETPEGVEIEGHAFTPATRSFVVRVPAIEDGSLLVEGERTGSFALADVAERATRVPSSARVASLGRTGPSSNRVDLAIFGDGYRAEEAGLFESDSRSLANQFLSISPYADYRNFVNVVRTFVPSAESGADHPPYDASCAVDDPSCCRDMTSQADPLAGTFVDTAFDGRYCAFGIQRLAVIDTTKVLEAAAAVPNWDFILVLLNDATYGGSGGFVSVTSTNAQAVDIARHEYGHSFAGLADEYDAETPGYPPCSDRDPELPGCEPNVTDETNRSLVKWEPWIAPATPVPTPETAAFSDAVGVFEGARYQARGMYRPRDRCLMNVLGVGFGEVCREEYVLDLYRGGWGVPDAGIDLIEPRSVSPEPNRTIDTDGSPVEFQAGLLQPTGSPPLEVTWTVDGAVRASAVAALTFRPPGPGDYDVELTVRDVTPFVLADSAEAGELVSRRRWTVRSTGGSTGCSTSDTTLCLEQGRFQVTVDWQDPAGGGRDGQVVPVGSDDSGLFSFFDPDNWEMLIKVLDACAVNDRFWVFLAATTDLEYTVTVIDTEIGTVRTYANAAGRRAPAVTDTDAFGGCPGSAGTTENRTTAVRLDRLDEHPGVFGVGSVESEPFADRPRLASAASNPCDDDGDTLCLNGSRFDVSVSWRDFSGASGSASVVPFRSDDSGLFYIFDPDNWELLIKVLDACALNGHYWVFAAATTDIEFTLRVRDSITDAVKEYDNALGNAADAIIDTMAFSACPP